MDAEEHDAVFAAVSHLPHLLAYALVHDVASREQRERSCSRFAAGGFRDFTRIASSHPEMWRDICVANRDALLRRASRGIERKLGADEEAPCRAAMPRALREAVRRGARRARTLAADVRPVEA